MSREGARAGSCVPTRIIEGRPAVKPPRFRLAGAMAFVAAVALNLAAFRALYDEPGEVLLFDALPTVNVLALVGLAGFRRRRLRAFALGFAAAGALSLAAFLAWADANPWSLLRYVGQPAEAADRVLERIFPGAHIPIIYVILIVALAIPHTVMGLAGGYLLAKAWSMIRRRKAI